MLSLTMRPPKLSRYIRLLTLTGLGLAWAGVGNMTVDPTPGTDNFVKAAQVEAGQDVF